MGVPIGHVSDSLDNVTSQLSQHLPTTHATPTRTHAACAPTPRPPRPSRHTRTGPRRARNPAPAGVVQRRSRARRRARPAVLPAQRPLGPAGGRHRPYPDTASLLAAADEATYDLSPEEIAEALASEPPPLPPRGRLLGRPHRPERRPRGLRGQVRPRLRHLPRRRPRARGPGPRPGGHPVTIGERSPRRTSDHERPTPSPRQGALEQRPEGRGAVTMCGSAAWARTTQPKPHPATNRSPTPTPVAAPKPPPPFRVQV